MKNNNDLLPRVEDLIRRLDDALKACEGIIGASPEARSVWGKHLEAAGESLKSPLFRVAIVGTVKAGKSTLINSLLETDLLKRGAGIITAFITRIVDSEKVGGWVRLKSWTQINEHAKSCLQTLPLSELSRQDKKVISRFDLRDSSHREFLGRCLNALRNEQILHKTGIDSNIIILSAYLGGYPEISEYVNKTETVEIKFGKGNIREHQKFVGKENVAIYLLDMELHWPLGKLGHFIEIGDCQGIDSPNPLHFSLVQDYLLKSHFIVYVVNTRIGFREADFKLLRVLEKLKLFANTAFVLNIDMDSHGSEEEWNEFEEKVRRDLSFLNASPVLHSFSCLYHLMDGMREQISGIDKMRLEMWEGREEFIARSRRGFMDFQRSLKDVILNRRKRLIVNTACTKLVLLTENLLDSLYLRANLSGGSNSNFSRISQEVENYNETVSRQLEAVENMLEGLQERLKKEFGKKVDEFFVGMDGSVTRIALDAIDGYQIEEKLLESKIADRKQMILNLYSFYHEFKELLTVVLVEKVKVSILEFAENLRERLINQLEKQGRAYWNLLSGTLKAYRQELESVGILKAFETPVSFTLDSFPVEVEVPPFDNLLSQDGIGRSAFMVRFGVRQMTHFLGAVKSKVFSRGKRGDIENYMHEILKESVEFMKNEAKKELMFSLQDYHQNFKFRYAYRLIDEYLKGLKSMFESRIEMAVVETRSVLDAVEQMGRSNREMEQKVNELKNRLELLRGDLASIVESESISKPELNSTPAD